VSSVLDADVRVVRNALASSTDQVCSVTLDLPRASAEKVLALLDAELAAGAIVVPVREMFTTTEAASMWGLSRPTLMKMIDSGEVAHIMVGTHHRILAQALTDFQRNRRIRREKAAKASAEFSNEIGLLD
jgi:excisionase family DNA binding protein